MSKNIDFNSKNGLGYFMPVSGLYIVGNTIKSHLNEKFSVLLTSQETARVKSLLNGQVEIPDNLLLED